MEHVKVEIEEPPAKRAKGDEQAPPPAFSDIAKLLSDAKAKYELGRCYMDGDGVPRNEDMAVTWWIEAGNQGYVDAWIALVRHYASRNEKDLARFYLGKASRPGNAEVEFLFGQIYAEGIGVQQDGNEAIRRWKMADAWGHVEARHCLIREHAYGQSGHDKAKAVEMCTELAQKGDVWAMEQLGFCYAKGAGVPRDEAKAIEWWTKAANAGKMGAQMRLARCYLAGKLVPKDANKALEWLSKATKDSGTAFRPDYDCPEDDSGFMWIKPLSYKRYGADA